MQLKVGFVPQDMIIIGPHSVRAPRRGLKKKKKPQIIFNYPRSSIKPESATDPIVMGLMG